MRDHKRGASAHDAVHTALDELFGTRVDGTRGLVQDEHRRIGDGHARDGEQLTLTNKEYELLLFLARHPNQVFSREDLYEFI